MKFSAAILVLGLAATVSAQAACKSVADEVPKCAEHCIKSAAHKFGCGPKEYECQCKPKAQSAIQSDAQACVVSACGSSAVQVLASASAVCACAATAKPEGPSSAYAITTGVGPIATGSEYPTGSGVETGTKKHKHKHHHTPTGTGACSGTSGAGVYPTSVLPSITPFQGDATAVAGSMGGIMAGLMAVIAAL